MKAAAGRAKFQSREDALGGGSCRGKSEMARDDVFRQRTATREAEWKVRMFSEANAAARRAKWKEGMF